jgi:hypothetical protein
MREIKFAGHIKFDGIDALLKKHILDNLPDVFSVKQINSDEYDIFKDMLLSKKEMLDIARMKPLTEF